MRYALYFTPDAASGLARLAAAWLGRDVSGLPAPQTDMTDDVSPEEWERWVAEPRRYGFHATLVAPFRLHPELNERDVVAKAAAFAGKCAAFPLPPLALSRLGPFLALTPTEPSEALQLLVDDAVDCYTPLRAPLTEAEIARRRPEGLTERQRDYLHRFGYPFVRDEFRFHFTLTGPLASGEAERLERYLQSRFAAALEEPLSFDAVSLFIEPEPGAPFLLHSRHCFPARSATKSARHAP